ncbi:DMT family transporter [Candidatus Hepatincola sp. Av]
MNQNIKAVFFSFLSFTCFSIMDIISRYILYNNLMDFSLYFFYIKTLTIVLFIVFGFLIAKRDFFIIKNKKVVFIRAILISINAFCVTLALKYLPLDIFYALVFLMPLLATILSVPLLKEKLKFINIIGVLIGFTGIIIALNPAYQHYSIIGIILCFVVILTGSLAGIIARKYLVNENPFSTTFYAFLMAELIAIFGLLTNIKSGNVSLSLPSVHLSIIILIGAIVTLNASSLYMKAYQYGRSMYVAPIQYIQIIYGSFFGYWLFGDKISNNTLAGIIIIILGTILNNNAIMKNYYFKNKGANNVF